MADVHKRSVLDPKRPLQLRRQSEVNLWDFLVKGVRAKGLPLAPGGHDRKRARSA